MAVFGLGSVRFFAALVIACGMLAAPCARAELAPPVVAVVDVPFLIQTASASKGIREKVDARQQLYVTEYNTAKDRIEAEFLALEKEREAIGPERYAEARRRLFAEAAALEETLKDRTAQLERASRRFLEQVRGEILRAVTAVAKKLGATVVLSKQQVVIVAKSLDITSAVSQRLTASLETVDLRLPE